MRILLFTGKGGVGKTTAAAATAVTAARDGLRTVVVSTDPAHSLADAVGVALPVGRPVPLEPGLDALQVSAAETVDPSWRGVQGYLTALLDAIGLDPVLADELTSLPGVDEIAALVAIERLAAAGAHDLAVIDCAPTAETLRLLALPEILTWHLDRLVPTQRAVLGALRPAALAAAGIPQPPAEVPAALAAWSRRMRGVQALLTPPGCSVRLVLTPESVVIAEARRMLALLGLHGFAVDGVVVNRVLPDAAAGHGSGRPDPWLAAWNEAQARGLAETRASFADIPITTVPFGAGEPIGLAALAEIGRHLRPVPPARLTDPATVGGVRVTREEAAYVLHMPLKGATSADVELGRRDDDLLIDVSGHHRVITLPSVLRRCTIRGAAMKDGVLTVTFDPDPEVWPRERSR